MEAGAFHASKVASAFRPRYKLKTVKAMSHKLDGSGTDLMTTLSMVNVE